MDIKDTISYAALEADAVLVTVYNLENSTAAAADLFSALGKENVNINMIALNPSCETTQTVSFTASGQDTQRVLRVIGELKKRSPHVRVNFNAGNCIATFCGDGVETECGVCAYVLKAFADCGIRIKLITTSKRTVACLFNERDYGKAEKMIEQNFKPRS